MNPAQRGPAAGQADHPRARRAQAAGQKIVMVTAYDAPGGRLADAAGVDLVLVGDSAAMTCSGTTPPSRRRWTR